VLAPEAEPRVPCEPAGAVAETAGIGRAALVDDAIDHRARELGVVRPRSPVEIVGADDQQHVVDDAHLGVQVDRCAVRILEVVHRDALATGAAENVDHAFPADAARGGAREPTPIGIPRHDCDDAQLVIAAERVGERERSLLRPEVLIFEVDEAAGATERLQVGARDAALTVGRERIRRTLCRIGAQNLHRVRFERGRIMRRGRQRTGIAGLPRQAPQRET